MGDRHENEFAFLFTSNSHRLKTLSLLNVLPLVHYGQGYPEGSSERVFPITLALFENTFKRRQLYYNEHINHLESLINRVARIYSLFFHHRILLRKIQIHMASQARVNFKLTFNGALHRFRSSLRGEALFKALSNKVADVTSHYAYELFWNGE